MGKWEMVRLGDVCEVVSGTTPSTNKPELWDGDVKWIAPAEISENSYFIYDTVKHISEKAGLKPMPAGTVLLSSRAPIGKVAIAGCEMCCNQGFKNLICSDQIYNRYLYRFLKGKTEYLNSLGRGATFKEISKPIVEQVEIPLPPLPVQQKIADILDRASALIEKRKAQIEKMDLLIKSQFVEMFGDPVLNPKSWNKVRFDAVSTVRQGLQIPISERKTVAGSNRWPYITIQYLNGNKEKEYIENPKSTVMCTKDDVLMTRTGNTGRVIIDVEGVFHNNFFLIDYDRTQINKLFLYYYLNTIAIQTELIKRAGTSTIPDLNHGEFYAITIYKPPLFLQNEFAGFVKRIDEQKKQLRKSLVLLELNYKSLMQKCFSGEIF